LETASAAPPLLPREKTSQGREPRLEPKEKGSKKRRIQPFYRIKAHSNPLSDNADIRYPAQPSVIDWKQYYPSFTANSKVEFADVGCGYGGLSIALATTFPDRFVLALEIREKVVEYVTERFEKMRKEQPGQYQNVAVVRTNAMKYLPNYFKKGQLTKLFFLFPDPHFKKSNHRRRIISPQLLAEYAFIVAKGGIVYTATDVEELHHWMTNHFLEHPLFERLTDAELENDKVVPLVLGSSEESKKVDKSQGKKFLAVFRRI